MSIYRHILVAVDLTDDAAQVVARAQNFQGEGVRFSLVHALEPLGFAYGGDIPMDLTSIQDQLTAHARAKLAELAPLLQVPAERQYVFTGMPEAEIHRLADQEGVDLIVIGSHGRHGLALLLGSTSTGVLHGAHCDVLAVRVGLQTA